VQEQCQNDVAFQLTCEGGQVTTSAVQKCEPYVCFDTATCRNKCLQDSHCDPDYYCGLPAGQTSGTVDCQEQLQQGTECDRARQCASGFCVDGVCCNSSCEGQCQACDVDGFVGVCVQVPSGPPHNIGSSANRVACDGAGGDCEGECKSSTNACTYEPHECGDSTCDAGTRSFGMCHVEANGTCTPQMESCGDYACDDAGKSCVADGTCTTTAQCADGAVCILSTGNCTVVSDPQCVEDHFVVSPDGTSKDCSPFKCKGLVCIERCGSIDDCIEGKVCDASGACIDPPPDPEPPSDCSAAAGTAGRGAPALGLALAAIALAAIGRRKRSAGSDREVSR
jgi:hypothetical protein